MGYKVLSSFATVKPHKRPTDALFSFHLTSYFPKSLRIMDQTTQIDWGEATLITSIITLGILYTLFAFSAAYTSFHDLPPCVQRLSIGRGRHHCGRRFLLAAYMVLIFFVWPAVLLHQILWLGIYKLWAVGLRHPNIVSARVLGPVKKGLRRTAFTPKYCRQLISKAESDIRACRRARAALPSSESPDSSRMQAPAPDLAGHRQGRAAENPAYSPATAGQIDLESGRQRGYGAVHFEIPWEHYAQTAWRENGQVVVPTQVGRPRTPYPPRTSTPASEADGGEEVFVIGVGDEGEDEVRIEVLYWRNL
ncbi:hypothetical protein GQ53DRAFT_354971 [Thozetella sp. PMI_491]|nr:hypothetical protein GQ53DRAFT_354971 [Thozetella sp. PMI_491]